MSDQQKDRIIMGLQAQREMATFPDEKDLVISLHNFILLRMPSGRP